MHSGSLLRLRLRVGLMVTLKVIVKAIAMVTGRVKVTVTGRGGYDWDQI